MLCACVLRRTSQFAFDETDESGRDGEKNDAHDNGGKVVTHKGDIAKEVSGKNKTPHPHNATDDAEHDEALIVHLAHTGDKRCKRADDGHETRQKNRLAAVPIHKVLRFINMRLIDGEAFVVHDEFAKFASDPIIDIVAHQCCRHQNDRKHNGVE